MSNGGEYTPSWPAAHAAPLGTPLPNSCAPLDAGFIPLGYLGNLTTETRAATHDVYSWGGDLVHTLQDRMSQTIHFNLSTTALHSLTDAASPPPYPSAHSWVFDTPHGRIVIPNAQTTHIKTTVNQSGAETLWETQLTLQAFPDANNTTTYLYNRTWEETWNDHIAAALEGNTQQAAALLAELAAGYPTEQRMPPPAAAATGRSYGSGHLTATTTAAPFSADLWPATVAAICNGG